MRRAWVAAVALAALAGCGKPSMVPVKGVVKLNGKPVPHCKVGFFPDTDEFDPDKHGYGYGVTDAAGAFEIQHPGGEKGIYPGRYKVTLVLWVDGKGKPIPADAKPSEVPGGVKNLMPMKYESLGTTPETVTVPSGGLEHTFDVSGS
jgi:hypothetical protein